MVSGQHFATQSCPLDRWHFFTIASLTHLKPHKYAVLIKVFGLAFSKSKWVWATPNGF